jgi:hypothetical protein
VACLVPPTILSLVYLAGAISAPFLLYPAAVCLAAAVLIFIACFSTLYTQVYVGDFEIPVKNGYWTAAIYPPTGTAELLLADLTPAGYKSLNGPFPNKLGLLKSLLISGDADILNRIIINAS